MKKAFIDFGNTNIKILIGNQIESMKYNSELIDFLELNNIEKVYYSSVNKETINLLSLINADKINVAELIPYSKIDFDSISGMGIDRKLGLIGAREISDKNICTIDCGSAITLNFVIDNKCIGGFIIPGLRLRCESLFRLSDIEKFDLESFDFDIGKNTKEAIGIGINYELAYGIKSIIERVEKEQNCNFEKFIFGGDSKLLRETLQKIDFSVSLQENLVLNGIKSLASKYD